MVLPYTVNTNLYQYKEKTMSTAVSKKTIVVDLDATLADYIGGWEANKDFPGEPREDVVKGCQRLKDSGYIIGILTTRPIELVNKWLKHYDLVDLIDFVNDNPWQPEGAGKHKPIAFAYIDDRGVRYDGTNMDTIVDSLLTGGLESWSRPNG